jgi:hypothetical protein
MRPGQQLKREWGIIEISTFSSVPGDKSETYRVDFMARNDSGRAVELIPGDYIRLLVDGVPRAPSSASNSFLIGHDSAEDFWAIFTIHSKPKVVYVIFGAGEAARSYARWPN